MDPILSAKSTNMADAFAMLLAIYQGPSGVTHGRIHRRKMTYAGNPFHQFIFHEKSSVEGTAWPAVRYLSADFFQWDGFFHVYIHTLQDMLPYLPKKLGLSDVQQGFAHERFRKESTRSCRVYSIEQIEIAARDATAWLTSGTRPDRATIDQMRETVRHIDVFRRRISSPKTGGFIPMTVEDLISLLEA